MQQSSARSDAVLRTSTQEVARFGCYLAAHGYSPHTVRNYCSDIDTFFRYLVEAGVLNLARAGPGSDKLTVGSKALAAVSAGDIRSYVAHLFYLGCAKSTIQRRLAAVNAFFRVGCQTRELSANPVQLVSAPKLEKRTPVFLTVDEAFAVVESFGPQRTFFALRDRAILELLYSTGIRVSELCGLSLFDVDGRLGQVRVLGKGGKERLVPVGNPAKDALKDYSDVRGRPLGVFKGPADPQEKALFLNRDGAPLSARSVNKIVHKYTALSGIAKQIGPHKLRHTCATHLFDAGMDLRDLQELLGHRRISTTSIYTHTSIERLKSVYRKAHPRS